MSEENKKMSNLASDTLPNQGFAKRSTLYQEFLAEREEILRHKWIESEKKGKDIVKLGKKRGKLAKELYISNKQKIQHQRVHLD